MTLKPLGQRVLIKRLEQNSQTDTGLFLPEVAKEKLNRGRVVACAEDCEDLSEGDEVIFGKYTGQDVEIDGIEHIVMLEEDVLGVVESDG